MAFCAPDGGIIIEMYSGLQMSWVYERRVGLIILSGDENITVNSRH